MKPGLWNLMMNDPTDVNYDKIRWAAESGSHGLALSFVNQSFGYYWY